MKVTLTDEIAKIYGLSVVEVTEQMIIIYKVLKKREDQNRIDSLYTNLKNELRELVSDAKNNRT